MASIAVYGDTIHTFIERHRYRGSFLPGFEELPDDTLAHSVGLTHIDHMVANVGWNESNRWVRFYSEVLGFHPGEHFADRGGRNDYSAVVSKPVANGAGPVHFPLSDPADGWQSRQAEEYLEFYHGPGIQHIALATTDILYSAAKLKSQGVEFLRVPDENYSDLAARVGRIDEPLADLAKLGILVDRDDEGYLLQAFTRPVEDRPTLFFEIIQRKGNRGFGGNNFKTVFQTIERERSANGKRP
jgi:4-hydroxyphenylpyruvate dioxygenase